MLNRLAGVLLYLIAYTPILLLQTLLFFFLFVDLLIAGEYRAALQELLYSPLKVFKMLYFAIALISSAGWQAGLTGVFSTSFAQIKTYFTDFYQIESKYFFAIFFKHYLNMYPGKYIGALSSKLSLLYFPAAHFDFYKHYGNSPHNPVESMTSNQLYDIVDTDFGQKTQTRLRTIQGEIESFLNAHQPAPNAEDKTFLYALNCLQYMQKNPFLGMHDLQVKPEHHLLKTPMNVLCLVWQVIDDHTVSTQEKERYQALVAIYLGNLQRSQSASYSALDNPECGTGLISSLLTILKALDPHRFRIQDSQTNSWEKMKSLLQEKMNQGYYVQRNAEAAAKQYMNTPDQPTQSAQDKRLKMEKECKESCRTSLKYYALFLNNTPQGRATTGLGQIDEAGVISTAEHVLEEWHCPETEGFAL